MVSLLNICHLSNYFPPRVMFICQNSVVSKLPAASRPTKSDLGKRLYSDVNVRIIIKTQRIPLSIYSSMSAVEQISGLVAGWQTSRMSAWLFRDSISKNVPRNQFCISSQFDLLVQRKQLRCFCFAVTGSDSDSFWTNSCSLLYAFQRRSEDSEWSSSHINQTESPIKMCHYSKVYA